MTRKLLPQLDRAVRDIDRCIWQLEQELAKLHKARAILVGEEAVPPVLHCPKCQREGLTVADFNKNRSKANGLQNQCRDCQGGNYRRATAGTVRLVQSLDAHRRESEGT